MATYDYTRAIETVNRLLVRFGQTGNLRYNGELIPVKFAPVDYDFNSVGGRVLAAGDRQVYMEPTANEPVPGRDLLYIDGVAHKIIPPVGKLDPDGTVIYYELQVRR